MGKKSRRKAKLRAAARMAQGMPSQPVYQPKPLATQMVKPQAVAAPIRPVAMPPQENRYQYVPAELREIGIIAGALFLILFILAFILH
jgi:hypothetical protein